MEDAEHSRPAEEHLQQKPSEPRRHALQNIRALFSRSHSDDKSPMVLAAKTA